MSDCKNILSEIKEKVTQIKPTSVSAEEYAELQRKIFDDEE